MLVCFLVYVCILSTYFGHCLPSTSPAPLKHSEIVRRTSPPPSSPDGLSEPDEYPSRTLQLIIDVVEEIAPVTLIENGVTYEVMPAHGFLHFGGTDIDGPYRLEICVVEAVASNDKGLVLQGFEYTLANKDRLVSQYPGRIVVDLPDTIAQNRLIIDPTNGGGLAVETLVEDPEYRIGPEYSGRINDCFTYLERFLNNIGTETSSEVQRIFDTSALWYKTWTPEEGAKYGNTINIREIVLGTVTGENSKSLKVFTLPEPEESACEEKTKRDGSCTLPSREVPDASDIKEENVFAIDPNASDLPANMLALDPVNDLAASSALAATNDIETRVTIARAGGVLKSFVTVGQEVLEKLGVALQDLLGPAFVILEFIGKNWKMAAIGAVNTAAAIAAGFAPEGPVGWIIDAAVFILFSSKSTCLHHNTPGGR